MSIGYQVIEEELVFSRISYSSCPHHEVTPLKYRDVFSLSKIPGKLNKYIVPQRWLTVCDPCLENLPKRADTFSDLLIKA